MKRKLTFKSSNLLTQGEEDIDSRDKEEIKEKSLLYLMTNGKNSSEDYDSSSSYSDDDYDINDLYNKLFDPLVKAKKKGLKSTNNKIEMLNEEIKMIRIENDLLNVMTKKHSFEFYNCSKCKVFKAKIKNLNKVL